TVSAWMIALRNNTCGFSFEFICQFLKEAGGSVHHQHEDKKGTETAMKLHCWRTQCKYLKFPGGLFKAYFD
ncbi:hypothetical protein, partial [Flagellimonas marinaquae]